jgi:hypothetical protein
LRLTWSSGRSSYRMEHLSSWQFKKIFQPTGQVLVPKTRQLFLPSNWPIAATHIPSRPMMPIAAMGGLSLWCRPMVMEQLVYAGFHVEQLGGQRDGQRTASTTDAGDNSPAPV